jgi:hypothetical protein
VLEAGEEAVLPSLGLMSLKYMCVSLQTNASLFLSRMRQVRRIEFSLLMGLSVFSKPERESSCRSNVVCCCYCYGERLICRGTRTGTLGVPRDSFEVPAPRMIDEALDW